MIQLMAVVSLLFVCYGRWKCALLFYGVICVFVRSNWQQLKWPFNAVASLRYFAATLASVNPCDDSRESLHFSGISCWLCFHHCIYVLLYHEKKASEKNLLKQNNSKIFLLSLFAKIRSSKKWKAVWNVNIFSDSHLVLIKILHPI